MIGYEGMSKLDRIKKYLTDMGATSQQKGRTVAEISAATGIPESEVDELLDLVGQEMLSEDVCPKCGRPKMLYWWEDATDELVRVMAKCPRCDYSGTVGIFNRTTLEWIDEN